MPTKKFLKLSKYTPPPVLSAKGTTQKALAEATPVDDTADDKDLMRGWLATSMAYQLFGDKKRKILDLKRNITGNTGSPANAAVLAQHTNNVGGGTCVTFGFRWDGVTAEEIQACRLAGDYRELVKSNIT